MPWTPAQRRLFAVQYRKGEMTKAEFDRRMSEGVRRAKRLKNRRKKTRKTTR